MGRGGVDVAVSLPFLFFLGLSLLRMVDGRSSKVAGHGVALICSSPPYGKTNSWARKAARCRTCTGDCIPWESFPARRIRVAVERTAIAGLGRALTWLVSSCLDPHALPRLKVRNVKDIAKNTPVWCWA